MSVNCENEKVSDTASYYTDTYEDNNQDWHNDIWTTQYSHFTLDEVGKDVDANSPTWWPPTRSSSPPTGTGLSRESPEAWLRELHIRVRDPREPSGGVASLPCGLGWQRRGQSPRTSASSSPIWRTGAGGGLGPSPLDSTLVSITCHKLIELNMLICRF